MEQVQVVIPTYNSERTLERCLDSIISLNYKNIDVMVVDNFSTDKTAEIVSRYPVTFIQKECNRSQAYNEALRRSSCKYLAFVDSDCEVFPEWLNILFESIDEEGVGVVGGFYKTPEDANIWSKLVGLELELRSKKFPRYIERLPSGCLLIKKECLEKVEFDEHLKTAEEVDWGYRIGESGYKMIYESRADIIHHHRSTIWSFFRQQFQYGKRIPWFYLKTRGAVKGDSITSVWMNFQPIVLLLIFAIGLLGIFDAKYFYLSGYSFCIFLTVLMVLAIRNTKFGLFYVYVVRVFAWSLGLIFFLFDLLRRVFK